LSARCGVSRRTVFRDLDVLRQASVPLQYDEEFQVYHLGATDFLPPTKFSPAEALAVLVLCHELGDVRQMPFLAPAPYGGSENRRQFASRTSQATPRSGERLTDSF